MDQWLWGYICFYTTVELVSLRTKNNTTEDYIQKCNGIPLLPKLPPMGESWGECASFLFSDQKFLLKNMNLNKM